MSKSKHLFFVRDQFSEDVTVCISDKTEVCVYGDVNGYKYFVRCLERAKTSKRIFHLKELDFRSHTMYCTILPAYRELKAARVKMIERVVFVGRQPKVELIIYGTERGYDYMIKNLEAFITTTTEDQKCHWHFDDFHFPMLIKRSVNMQITDPLKSWTKEKVLPWVWTAIYDAPLPTHLPEATKYCDPEPYEGIHVKHYRRYLSLEQDS